MITSKGKFYSGTSGIVLPVPNKASFPSQYQERSRLCYYASLYNSLEVNSSFYRVPMGSTVAKWAADVPADFRFTFKLWRDITHVRDLLFREEDVYRFMQTINAVEDKKGCLLLQFPPGLSFSAIGQLEKLLITVRKADPDSKWKLFLEFRKTFWYTDKIYDLLKKYHAGMVLHDKAGSQTDFTEPGSDHVYLRFHGPGGDYKGSYTEDFLHEYAQYINSWMEEGKTVYTYFNNTMGDAVKNLMTLNNYVNS